MLVHGGCWEEWRRRRRIFVEGVTDNTVLYEYICRVIRYTTITCYSFLEEDWTGDESGGLATLLAGASDLSTLQHGGQR